MKLVKLENNTGTVVAESDDIAGLQKLASADSKLVVLEQFPIPGKKVANGQIVSQTEAEKIASNFYSLEDFRKIKIAAIIAKHDTDISAGCTFDGKVFNCAGDTRRLLEETITIGEYPVTWLTQTREAYSLDATKAQNLLNAMRAFVKPIKLNRYSKEALVYSKNTVADIAEIVA